MTDTHTCVYTDRRR